MTSEAFSVGVWLCAFVSRILEDCYASAHKDMLLSVAERSEPGRILGIPDLCVFSTSSHAK